MPLNTSQLQILRNVFSSSFFLLIFLKLPTKQMMLLNPFPKQNFAD